MTCEPKTTGNIANGLFVMCRDDERNYTGPCMQITYDDTWLHLTTDKYEGHAMINIEALPHIIKALAKIQKAIKQ